MRRAVKKRPKVSPDPVYNSERVEKFVNSIMKEGKKTTARKIVYKAFEKIEKDAKQPPLEVFEDALKNVSPQMEVRSRRVGGANYQVPHEVRPERQQALAFRWIIGAAQAKTGKPVSDFLAEEIIAASKNEGEAFKKRENVHKMAESNRAFAHFAWTGRKKR